MLVLIVILLTAITALLVSGRYGNESANGWTEGQRATVSRIYSLKSPWLTRDELKQQVDYVTKHWSYNDYMDNFYIINTFGDE